VEFNLETRNGVIRDAKGNVLPSINAFWFAWYAFHPETQIFSNSNYGLHRRKTDRSMFPTSIGILLKK